MKLGIHRVNPRSKASRIFSNFSRVKAWSWRIPLALLLVIFISGILSPQISAGDGDGQIENLPPIPEPVKKHPKLDSSLAEKADKAQSPKPLGPSKILPQTVEPPVEIIKVIVEVEPGKKIIATGAIQAAGGNIETTYENLVQVMVPVNALTALADNPNVRFIQRPIKPVPAIVTTQGLSVIGATTWQSSGLNGNGVKIAILDLGFQGYASLLGTELPSSVTTKSFRADLDIQANEKHGTAVAEIVYDIAPAASFYLVNVDTVVELGNAVDWLIAQNVNIISHSAGWSGSGPGDGTGPVNAVVTKANNAGILWVNAAGNEGQQHWSGSWSDANNNQWLEFQSADETQNISVGAGQEIAAYLTWDDTWGSSANDYDLYLYNPSMTIVDTSVNVQNGIGYPLEYVFYVAPSAGTYHISIRKYLNSKVSKFNLFSNNHNLQFQVAAGSLGVPADSPYALSVGAVAWNTPTTLEIYSSQGPTTDGRIKPDIVAPTGVSTVSYGTNAFPGTSSSAPHVSAAAALVKQANPTWTPAQIKSFLESRAVELGAAGKDNLFGSGRLNLGEAEIIIDSQNDTRFTKDNGPYWWYAQDHTDASADGWFNTVGYDKNVRYTFSGNGAYWGRWESSLPQSGKYSVFAWIPNFDPFDPNPDGQPNSYVPTSSANYKVFHQAGVTTVAINQNLNKGGWKSLGEFVFQSVAKVELTDNTGEPLLASAIAFDAIKFGYIADSVPPSTPGNLSITGGTPTSITKPTFTWAAATDATSGVSYYEVRIDGTDASFASFGNVLTYTPATALTEGSHTFYVRAVDWAGNKGSAASVAFTVDVTPPGAPGAPTMNPASPTNNVKPIFSWTAATDATTGVSAYEARIDGTDPSYASFGNVLTYTSISNLSDGAHTFYVRAVDGAGNKGNATTFTFTIDITPPAAPTLAAPASGSRTSNTTPALDWADVADPSGVTYSLQIDDNADFSSPALSKTALTSSDYTLDPGETLSDSIYYWRVRAVDGAGNIGPWSGFRSFIIDLSPPAAPSLASPADSVATGTTPAFDWADVSDPAGGVTYTLQVGNQDFSTVTLTQSGLTASEYALTTAQALAKGGYRWRVKAADGLGNVSVWSASRSLTVVVGLADTAWPMFRHDLQHTGRSPYVGPTSTPALKWSYAAGASIYSSPAIGADGAIYVGSYNIKLNALNPDGTLRWSYATGDNIISSPAIGADGAIYVSSNKLYALNPNGALKWSYTTGGTMPSSPAIGADGTLYVGSYDNKLYALNPDGTLKWSYATGGYISRSSPAIGADGAIYVGSGDYKLYALNPNGALRWAYPTGSDIVSSPANGADGAIYIGSTDNKLYALNPDGSLRWSYGTGSAIRSSPAIGVDGAIYVGSDDGKLYALNPNGTLK